MPSLPCLSQNSANQWLSILLIGYSTQWLFWGTGFWNVVHWKTWSLIGYYDIIIQCGKNMGNTKTCDTTIGLSNKPWLCTLLIIRIDNGQRNCLNDQDPCITGARYCLFHLQLAKLSMDTLTIHLPWLLHIQVHTRSLIYDSSSLHIWLVRYFFAGGHLPKLPN